MARESKDREDLFAEATALVERVEFSIPAFADRIVAGFRRDGGLSLFFGAETVYQFNSSGELRRAFATGLIYKAERRQLVSLSRVQSEQGVELLRHDLAPAEQLQFLDHLQRDLEPLRVALHDRAVVTHRQVPPDRDVLDRLIICLGRMAGTIAIAASPRSG